LTALARPGAQPGRKRLAVSRANWLSNSVFETFDDIVDAACEAWRNLVAKPDVIASIGMRDCAHVGVGQSP
jgi:hypothetical protein